MIVNHRTGSYPIHFGSLGDRLAALPANAFVVTDKNVLQAHGEAIGQTVPILALEPGEGSKTPETYLQVIDWLASQGAQRNALVVALGGGVVGDLVGFAAASYMRGVAFLQIPTTLLAQVDSSVGGKVGVDLPTGKNMLGAFYPPTEVFIAIDALTTLPPRQIANGMAEVLKYGFIMAPEILDMDPEDWEPLVQRCIECKKEVVEADELETTGLRAILNFGHTVGHALEAVLSYEELLHGEAISIGMAVEANLSEQTGLAPAGTRQKVEETLKNANLPVRHPLLSEPVALIDKMRRDKKATDGRLAFSLLKGIGSCELVNNVPVEAVVQALSL